MDLDVMGPQLHDRATRGQPLTQEEADALRAWYAQQDQAELAQIVSGPSPNLASLQEQVDQALVQLARIAQQLRRLDQENAALRRENARLRAQLAVRSEPQPA
jgi:cell shape-determining protein MreC